MALNRLLQFLAIRAGKLKPLKDSTLQALQLTGKINKCVVHCVLHVPVVSSAPKLNPSTGTQLVCCLTLSHLALQAARQYEQTVEFKQRYATEPELTPVL